MMSAAADALAALVTAAQQGRPLQEDHQRLLAIEAWALASLPVTSGDAVVITEPINTDNDWRRFGEALVPGCTGIVSDFWLSSRSGEWCGYFEPEVLWSTSGDWGRRRESRPGLFMLPLRKMRRRTEDDQPLAMPDDAKDWGAR